MLNLCEATVCKEKKGYYVVYPEYFDRKRLGPFKTIKEAKNAYMVQLAEDYIGASIRDNSIEEKIKIGESIEKNGMDENGSLREVL